MKVSELDEAEWRRTDGGFIQGCAHTGLLLNHKVRNKIVMECVGRLRSIEALDSIVVCGTSGLLVGPQVSEILNLNLVIVRKPNETSSSYSDFDVEGTHPSRYIILDDLICSGKTVRNILRAINSEYYRVECLGAYFYLQDQCAYRNCPDKFVYDFNINYL